MTNETHTWKHYSPHLFEHPGDVGPFFVSVLVLLDQMHDDGEREHVDSSRQRHLDLPADDAVTGGG